MLSKLVEANEQGTTGHLISVQKRGVKVLYRNPTARELSEFPSLSPIRPKINFRRIIKKPSWVEFHYGLDFV